MRCESRIIFRWDFLRRFRRRTFRECLISCRKNRVRRRWSFTATGKRFTSSIEMRLGQIKWNGQTTAAIFNHQSARPIPEYTLLDLITRAEKEGEALPKVAE